MSPSSQESVESISKSLRRASQLFQSEPQKAGDVRDVADVMAWWIWSLHVDL
jgi:hypothetical protein